MSSSARLDPLIGTLVGGRYLVVEAIGSGGMGRVYRASHEAIGRDVALKVVRWDCDEEEMQAQERLRLEAAILGRLDHPNIVTLFDAGQIDGALQGQSFLAMELVDGATLEHHMAKESRLAPRRVVQLARQIVAALDHAHTRGVIHRDLKPANVIVTNAPDGTEHVKLLDFGVGKIVSPGRPLALVTGAGLVIGTPAYMAPEQPRGRSFPASDMYALGVMMFEALTGRLPFADDDDGVELDERAFARTRSGRAPRIDEAAPGILVPSALELLVRELLAFDPAARPTARDAGERLATCEEELRGVVVPQQTTQASPIARPRLVAARTTPRALVAEPANAFTGSFGELDGGLRALARRPYVVAAFVLVVVIAAALLARAWRRSPPAAELGAMEGITVTIASSAKQAPRSADGAGAAGAAGAAPTGAATGVAASAGAADATTGVAPSAGAADVAAAAVAAADRAAPASPSSGRGAPSGATRPAANGRRPDAPSGSAASATPATAPLAPTPSAAAPPPARASTPAARDIVFSTEPLGPR